MLLKATARRFKLIDMFRQEGRRVYWLRHDRCTLAADNSPGQEGDHGWLGAMFAGSKVWPQPLAASPKALQEAEALLPVEAMHPNLGRKGKRGPEMLDVYMGQPKKAGERKRRW